MFDLTEKKLLLEILFVAFCSFHRCCLIRGLRYYLNHGWDSNRQLLVNRPSNIHSCHLHLTWQLPAPQRTLFRPQTSGPTQQRESPVLFFFFLNRQSCLRWPHLNFQKPVLHQIFQLSLYFCTVEVRNSKDRGFTMWAIQAVFDMSQPGLTWLDSTGHPSAAGF